MGPWRMTCLSAKGPESREWPVGSGTSALRAVHPVPAFSHSGVRNVSGQPYVNLPGELLTEDFVLMPEPAEPLLCDGGSGGWPPAQQDTPVLSPNSVCGGPGRCTTSRPSRMMSWDSTAGRCSRSWTAPTRPGGLAACTTNSGSSLPTTWHP